MANPFDEFDEVQTNPFDEFDEAAPKSPLYGGGVTSDIRAGLAGGADTALWGFADEAKAGLQALANEAAQKTGFKPDVPISETYDYFLNKSRGEAEQLQQENPNAYGTGQIAGAIAPAVLLPMSAAKQGVTTLGKYGKGLGSGMASGGLYGIGSGEGSTGERVVNAWDETLLGGVGGVGGVGVGQALGAASARVPQGVKDKIAPMTARALSIFKSNKVQGGVLNATQKEVDSLNPLRVDGDIFSKSKGQRNQNSSQQILENQALAKIHGEDAYNVAQRARIAQSRERKDFLSRLGDLEKVENPSEIVENIAETIQAQAKSAKTGVNNAYDLAREGGGVKISVDDIQDGLFANIVKAKKDGGYNINAMPLVQKPIKDLTRLLRSSQGKRFTNANLQAMEHWRTGVTNSMNSTTDRTEKKFLGQMLTTYDNFMYKTASEAVDKGDEAAILAFRDAVSKRRNYGKLYESDKFVQDIVSGEKGIDDVAKDLIGTGSIVGKKRMEKTYDAIIKASGDESDLVRQDLQAAFAKKLLQQSIEGLEEGGENSYLSAGKLQTALRGLFESNRKFAIKLYGEDNYKAAMQAIKELEPISKTQPSTSNPSGSGYAILRVLNKIPLIQIASESFEGAGKAGKAASVQKSFAEVIEGITLKPQSKLFRPSATGKAAAAVDFKPDNGEQ